MWCVWGVLFVCVCVCVCDSSVVALQPRPSEAPSVSRPARERTRKRGKEGGVKEGRKGEREREGERKREIKRREIEGGRFCRTPGDSISFPEESKYVLFPPPPLN